MYLTTISHHIFIHTEIKGNQIYLLVDVMTSYNSTQQWQTGLKHISNPQCWDGGVKGSKNQPSLNFTSTSNLEKPLNQTWMSHRQKIPARNQTQELYAVRSHWQHRNTLPPWSVENQHLMRELHSHSTQSITCHTLIIRYIIPEQTNQTLNLNEAFGVRCYSSHARGGCKKWLP